MIIKKLNLIKKIIKNKNLYLNTTKKNKMKVIHKE